MRKAGPMRGGKARFARPRLVLMLIVACALARVTSGQAGKIEPDAQQDFLSSLTSAARELATTAEAEAESLFESVSSGQRMAKADSPLAPAAKGLTPLVTIQGHVGINLDPYASPGVKFPIPVNPEDLQAVESIADDHVALAPTTPGHHVQVSAVESRPQDQMNVHASASESKAAASVKSNSPLVTIQGHIGLNLDPYGRNVASTPSPTPAIVHVTTNGSHIVSSSQSSIQETVSRADFKDPEQPLVIIQGHRGLNFEVHLPAPTPAPIAAPIPAPPVTKEEQSASGSAGDNVGSGSGSVGDDDGLFKLFDKKKSGTVEDYDVMNLEKQEGLSANSAHDVFVTRHTIVLISVFALLVVLVFSFLRERLPGLYHPRSYESDEVISGFCAWIHAAMHVKDEEILERTGLDGFMLLRFLQLMTKLFFLSSLAGIPLCLAHWQGSEFSTNLPLAKLGIGNLVSEDRHSSEREFIESPLLWLDMLNIWFVSAVLMWLIEQFDIDFLAHRLHYNLHNVARASVLVRGIPNDGGLGLFLNADGIFDFFDKVHPGRVADVVLIQKTSPSTQGTGDNLSLTRRSSVTTLNSTTSVRSLLGRRDAMTDSAFVTFQSARDAHIAMQLQYGSSPDRWSMSMAPHPKEIIWPNLLSQHDNASLSYTRRIFGKLAVALLFFFWVTPVVFMGSLANLDSWRCQAEGKGKVCFDWIDSLRENSPELYYFIEGILATAGLKAFIAVLPTVLVFLAHIEGLVTMRDIDLRVQNELFIFQTVFVLLLTTLVNGIFPVLRHIIERPASTLTILSHSVPKVSNYYLNFSILGIGLVFLDLVQTPLKFLKYSMTPWDSLTAAERIESSKELNRPEAYPQVSARFTLYASIGLLYCTIAPIILPVILSIFGLATVLYKYKLCFMDYPEWDAGGSHWHSAIEHVLISLLLCHWTMLGYFIYLWNMSARETESAASWRAILLLPLPFLTIFYFLKRRWRFNHMYLPLAEIDKEDPPGAPEKAVYIQPMPESNVTDVHSVHVGADDAAGARF